MHALASPDVRGAARSALRRTVVLLAVTAVAVTGAAAPAAADGAGVTISGHGYGHGRGMGQYGAFGYAVDHGWSYQQILDHFYGGTSLATDAGNPILDVELTSLTDRDTILTSPELRVNGAPIGAAAVLVRGAGNGAFQVFTGPSCAGPWSLSRIDGSGLVVEAAPTADQARMVAVCEPAGVRAYRGRVKVLEKDGHTYVLNQVFAEDYLRGVVPRESPSSWGNAGSGRGLQALKAQAVAARSYAESGLGGARRASTGHTCDTESCQVYRGTATIAGGTLTSLEAATTDRAVAETAGQVRRGANGAIARTEFSSSTGGWTAGGTFPAVPDEGDDTTANPNRNWSVGTDLGTVAAKLGTGTIRSFAVTGRNGLGADGGRVTEVTVITTDGARRTFTGNAVRLALGLKSDWFSITVTGSPEAAAVVTALYRDLLSRDPDPSGLATFAAAVDAQGTARGVAETLTYSVERSRVIVAEQYRAALRREPDPVGWQFWTDQLRAGMSIHNLQAGIFSSPEAVATLGGGSLEAWVAEVYRSLLGRPASPEDVALWSQTARTSGTAAVVQGIAGSAEAAQGVIVAWYQRMLGRFPDASGLASFMPYATQGRGDYTLPIAIGESLEYRLRAQTR